MPKLSQACRKTRLYCWQKPPSGVPMARSLRPLHARPRGQFQDRFPFRLRPGDDVVELFLGPQLLELRMIERFIGERNRRATNSRRRRRGHVQPSGPV
jgi:hypothetical protein